MHSQNIKTILCLFVGIFFLKSLAFSQCPIKVSANHLTIICGDTVILKASAQPQDYIINNDFNTLKNQPGPGWEQSPSATYTNPCGAPPAGGQTYMWMGNFADVPRILSTTPFDLSSGGIIKFDLKYAYQGGQSPCEGPDLPEEGVFVQFSVGGGNWQTIKYFETKEGTDPIMTNWSYYQLVIPAEACKPNTRIRWIQLSSSGIDYDNWGLDNIQIARNSPEFLFDWSHDPNDPSQSGNTPGVTPYSDSTFFVKHYNKSNPSDSCSGSVKVTTLKPTATIFSDVTTACSTQDINLLFTPIFSPNPTVCGIGKSNCGEGKTGDFTIGTKVTEPGNGFYNPLGTISNSICNCLDIELLQGNCDRSYRTQFIIKKEEFPEYFRGGQITSLTFNAENLGLFDTYENFSVKMGCTPLDSFQSSDDYITNLNEVTFLESTRFVNGENKILFYNIYNWSGKENIAIEISWHGPGFRRGNITKTETAHTQTLVMRGCQSSGTYNLEKALLFNFRPIVRLHACYYPVQNIIYEWTPTALLNDPSVSNPTAHISSDTTFKVTARLSNSPQCAVEGQITINHNNASVDVFTTNRNTICDYKDSIQLKTTVQASAKNRQIVSYRWTPNENINDTTINTPTVSPKNQTIYQCTVTDNVGCEATDTMTIHTIKTITPTFISNSPICAGDTLFIRAQTVSNAIYSWEGPKEFSSTSNSFFFANADTTINGYYKCEITYKGCKGKLDSVYAAVKSIVPSKTKYSSNAYCKASSNPTPYKNLPGIFSSTPAGLVFTNNTTGQINLNSSAIGKYIIKFIPNDTQCYKPVLLPIEILNSYNPSFSYPSYVCQGTDSLKPILNDTLINNFTLASGDSTYLEILNPRTGLLNIKKSLPGSYTIQNNVNPNAGCSNTYPSSTFTIEALPNPNWSGVTNKSRFCDSDTLKFNLIPIESGGTFYGIGVNNNTFSPYNLNTDSLDIKYLIANSKGCTDSSSKKLYILKSPKPKISGIAALCPLQPLELSTSFVASKYFWNNIPGNQFYSTYVTDTTQIYLRVVDNKNCSGYDTITIFTLEAPKDTISGVDSICQGENTILSSTGKYPCFWLPSNQSSNTFHFNYTQSTLIKLVSTAENGCVDTVRKLITVLPLPKVTISDIPSFCNDQDSTLLNYGNPEGGVYTLDNSIAEYIIPQKLAPGTHNIKYTYTSEYNCSAFNSSTFNIYPIPSTPTINIGGNNCERDSILLSTRSLTNTNYYWSGPGFLLNPQIPNNTAEVIIRNLTGEYAGIYSVYITQNNCSSELGSTNIPIKISPTVAISPAEAKICEDSILYLTSSVTNAIKISGWEWRDLNYPNTILNLNPQIQFKSDTSTIYQVRGISSENCSAYAIIDVKVFAYPEVEFTLPDKMCLNETVIVEAKTKQDPNYTFSWFPTDKVLYPNGASTSILTNRTDTFTLWLNAANEHCISSNSNLVEIEDCDKAPHILVTNAFSPNGDGINDYFTPQLTKVAQYNFSIYNRWGSLIFETTKPNEGWDGKIDNDYAQEEAYVYLIVGIGNDGTEFRKVGTITLVR